MSTDPVAADARALWEELAAVTVSFTPAPGLVPAVAPRAMICPPGWAGFIRLGNQAIATAPSSAAATLIQTAITRLPVDDLVDPVALGAVLPLAAVLGPATLAYTGNAGFRPVPPGRARLERLPGRHPGLGRLLRSAGSEDAAESGMDEITSPAFAVCAGDAVIAAAGYRIWPNRTAQLSVLTAPDRRGEGLARVAGSAAVQHALDAGLLAQWRARAPESRKVALALGFRELGAQLSVRLS
ncbi:GNAT family N-acetyltransferase [Nocardia sp. NPDC003963]